MIGIRKSESLMVVLEIAQIVSKKFSCIWTYSVDWIESPNESLWEKRRAVESKRNVVMGKDRGSGMYRLSRS